ncbi:hypothetical protein SAMN02927930_02144 [Pseudidiomarina indica]|uniref:Uncharacterized protein n=1 Tax=Pseudidiomarina indica TaxID=1159017 RepID=A0A1G6EBL6_9GAMM|nr:hypothetical protein [Pseudidiomarina indica]SDB54847.1 hypothetical protein SAMN02927930_02144 [Pseudidiomarina indica]
MKNQVRIKLTSSITGAIFWGGDILFLSVRYAIFLLALLAMLGISSSNAHAQSQCQSLNANSMEDFSVATSSGGQICIELKGLTPGETYIQVDTVYNFTTPTKLGYDVHVELNNNTIYSRNIFLPDDIDLAKLSIGSSSEARLILSNAQNKSGYTYTFNVVNSKEIAHGFSIISIAVIAKPTPASPPPPPTNPAVEEIPLGQ